MKRLFIEVQQRGNSGLGVPAVIEQKTETRVSGYRIDPLLGTKLPFDVKHDGKGFKIGSGTGTARFSF